MKLSTYSTYWPVNKFVYDYLIKENDCRWNRLKYFPFSQMAIALFTGMANNIFFLAEREQKYGEIF